jgi:hypothetical protein
MHTLAPVKVFMNTDADVLKVNMRSCLERGLPEFQVGGQPNRSVAIVAGGPSLSETYADCVGMEIYACNGAAKYLSERGIDPDFCVLADARPEIVELVREPIDTTYLVASVCHPSVFDALKGYKVVVWHCQNNFGEREILHEDFARTKTKHFLVGGGSTCGLRSIYLAYLKGHRDLHLLGFDSCHSKGVHHAYRQDFNDDDIEGVVPIICGERLFRCAPWMASQAQEFQVASRTLADAKISVHGDGLIAEIVNQQHRPVSLQVA